MGTLTKPLSVQDTLKVPRILKSLCRLNVMARACLVEFVRRSTLRVEEGHSL